MAVDKKVFYVKISSPVVKISSVTECLCISVEQNNSFKVVRNKLLERLDLDQKSYVVKVRNNRGSVIALTGRTSANSIDNPYHVEIIPCHYNVKPTIKDDSSLNAFMNTKLKETTKRLDRLENAIPVYHQKIGERVMTELQQNVKPKLDFLAERLERANLACWEGSITHSPLW